jgi:hypothetical protein
MEPEEAVVSRRRIFFRKFMPFGERKNVFTTYFLE